MNTINTNPASKEAFSLTQEEFDRIESEIYRLWPTAAQLPKDKDTVSLYEYAKRTVRANKTKATEERREEFRTYFAEKVTGLLGEKVGKSVFNQLKTNHSVATAHHFCPLNPKVLAPTFQSALPGFGSTEPEHENVIVLACAGISFNNPWGARGYQFHLTDESGVTEHSLNYFGRSVDADPVMYAKPFGAESKKAFEKTLLHLRSSKQIHKREFNRLWELTQNLLFTPEILSQKNYLDQITLTNFKLWEQIFAEYPGSKPNLVFLSQEKVAIELMVKHHIFSDSFVNSYLFDPVWHKLAYKHFSGIDCAFDIEKWQGTFLFWGVENGGKKRTQLFLRDGDLSSLSGRLRIPLNPESIASGLREGRLIPSVMLTFLVLSMYYGLFLSGGLDQPHYLTEIKAAHLKLLAELNMHEEIVSCKNVVPNDFVISRPTLLFLEHAGTYTPATSLDLLVYDKQKPFNQIIESSKHIPFAQFLYRLYPELYTDYCKSEALKKPLTATVADFEAFTGIAAKIPPWAQI